MATSVKKVKGNPAFAYSKIKSAGSKHAEVDQDKLIIRFKDDALQPVAAVAARGKATVAAFRSALPESVAGPVRRLTENLGLSEIVPLFTGRPAGAVSVKSSFERHTRALVKSVTRSPVERLRGVTVCTVDAKSVTAQELKRLRSSNAIASVERLPLRWLAATKKPKVKVVDPMRNAQWGLRAIGWFDVETPDASMVESPCSIPAST